MAKNSYIYFCSECGYESSKWMGQCPGCKAWNSFIEEKVTSSTKGKSTKTGSYRDAEKSPYTLSEISTEEEERLQIGINELDRVLGGCIVKGSLVLVGWDPGIGKSTLLLQVCKHLSDKGHDVLYVSGEESLRQIKLRASRIGTMNDKLKLFCETNLDVIEETIKRNKHETVVIDSIHTMFREEVSSAPGTAA